MSRLRIRLAALAAALTLPLAAAAVEYPIGAPQQRSGMEIAAVYLQPVATEPAGRMRAARESDVHLEADIQAMASNPNGFQEGAWIPFLLVKYEVVKLPEGKVVAAGEFMAMVANDGAHYGDNVKLAGPGKYRLKYTIYPPNAAENPAGRYFGRHIDRLTGVRPWFKPFPVEWEFVYAGIGKKGGY